MEILDSEGALDRSFTVHSPKLRVARVDNSSKEEEEMALNPRKGLKELLTGRNKGLLFKDALKSQPFPTLPPPLPPTLNLLPMPKLKKKRKEEGVEKGGAGPLEGA